MTARLQFGFALLAGLALPTLSAAEAIWRRDPPPPGPLIAGPRTLIQPGSQKPACLEVRLKDEYRQPFQLHAVVQHPGRPPGWCDARTLACYAPGQPPGGRPARSPVSMVRWDKGRLSTATKVRYCATFANHGSGPATVWLTRPGIPAASQGKAPRRP